MHLDHKSRVLLCIRHCCKFNNLRLVRLLPSSLFPRIVLNHAVSHLFLCLNRQIGLDVYNIARRHRKYVIHLDRSRVQ